MDAAALAAFLALPPPHRRDYLDWVEAAKKPEPRARRIGRMVARILGRR